MITHARGIAVLLAVVLAAQAQSPSQNWSDVKTLAASAEIRVNLNASRVEGRFQSATDDSLTIDSDKGPETLPRQDVARVSVKAKGHRGRNALIGLAAGAGAGAIAGAATGDGPCTGFCIGPRISKGEAAGLGVAVFGAIGTLIGAVLPTGGWRAIYSR